MKKQTVYFKSGGESGNIYHIIALVRNTLRKQRRIADFNELLSRVQNSHSYKEALKIIREYVDLKDEYGKF